MPIAVNKQTGEAMFLDQAGQWKPARIAKNPETGETLAWDGSEWQPVKAQKSAPDLLDNPLSNMTDLAVGAMTFGLADEVGAAGTATGKAIGNLVQGKPADWMKNYQQAAAQNNARLERFAKENPVASTAAEIVGGFANPVAGVLGKLATAGKGAGIFARTGRAGLAGAAAGGLYGAGNATGGFGDRLKGAVEGSVLGGATGLVLSPIIEGLVMIGQKGLQNILNRVGGLSDAERTVARALRDLGDGDIRKGLDKVREGLQKGGPGTAPVDVMGMQGQRIARAAANVPGEGSEIADKFVQRRMTGRGYRFRRALDTLAPEKDAGVATNEIAAIRAKRTGPKYDQIATTENLLPESEYQKLASIPYYKEIEKKVLRDPLYDFGNADPRSMAVVHRVKQRIDDEIGAAHARGRGSDEPLMLDVQRDVLKAADKAFPEYRDVRNTYAGYSRQIDAIKDGQKFHLKSPEELNAMLSAMSPQEQEAFRLGARNAIDKMIATDTQSAANKLADKKLGLWERIRVLFPDNQSFQNYKQAVENEIRRIQTERFVGPRAGSHTEPLKQDVRQFLQGGKLTEKIPEAATDYARWSVPGLTLAPLRVGMQKLTEPNQRKAADLARLLLEMNRPKALRNFERLARPMQVQIDNERRKALARALSVPTSGVLAGKAVR